jgi:YVTN family beta-propeller protein
LASLSIVAIIAILLLAALASDFTAGLSTSSLLAGGSGGTNSVTAHLRGAHLQDAFLSETQHASTALLSDNSPRKPAVVATVPVGSQPMYAAYDAGTGQVLITNLGSNNVSVINDTMNSVVASVTVGNRPWAVGYDATADEVFVTNLGPTANPATSNMSVINDGSDQVVAWISAGSYAYLEGIAYDAATGQVFVTNLATGNINVVNDTTNAVVATIPDGGDGSDPWGMAYDAATGQVFVANSGFDNVSVVSDTNDTVVANIPVGEGPDGVTYDPAKGQVFVTNLYSSTVSVISDRTDRVVATVPVGSGPYGGAAYDAATGQMFVANSGSGNVSVINDTTDKVVAWVPVGSNPIGAAYDSAKGEVFVANSGSDDVSVISFAPPTYTVKFATSPWSCGSIMFNGTTYSSGQSVSVHGGNYTVSAVACAGYTLQNMSGTGLVTVSSGKVMVDGAGGIVAMFTSTSSSSTAGLLGLPGNDGYYVCGGVAAIVVATILALVLVRRTRTKPTASSGPATERPCPACGATNLRDSAFCESCGKPLPSLP